MKWNDPAAKRYILDFTCSDPFLMEGVEMVALRVHGQSFMLNQIRKMVGAAVEIVRSGALAKGHESVAAKEAAEGGGGEEGSAKGNVVEPKEEDKARMLIRKMTKEQRYAVPTAPAEGLFLNLCCFPGYDKRYVVSTGLQVLDRSTSWLPHSFTLFSLNDCNVSQKLGRPRATLDSEEQVAAGNAFKTAHIHPHIAAQIRSKWPDDAFTNFALHNDCSSFPMTQEERSEKWAADHGWATAKAAAEGGGEGSAKGNMVEPKEE